MKNFSYGRHWISKPMRRVAPMPKQTKIDGFFLLFFSFFFKKKFSFSWGGRRVWADWISLVQWGWFSENAILFVFLFKEISFWSELSSQPHIIRILGDERTDERKNKRKSFCLSLDYLKRPGTCFMKVPRKKYWIS